MPRELDAVAEALKHGRTVEPITVRLFLSWFQAMRRGIHVVREIRDELKRVGVETDPDFEPAWIDSQIGFRLVEAEQPTSSLETLEQAHTQEALGSNNPVTAEISVTSWVTRDPTYRISKLEAANAGVVRIAPDESISRAVTLMLSRDFSQLPVMTTEREVKGLVSWRSIGSRMALGNRPEHVRDAMEQAHEVSANASIFDAITLIVRHGHVLVRSAANVVTGIVTASDLSLQFQNLTEPFLMLSEIENLAGCCKTLAFTLID